MFSTGGLCPKAEWVVNVKSFIPTSAVRPMGNNGQIPDTSMSEPTGRPDLQSQWEWPQGMTDTGVVIRCGGSFKYFRRMKPGRRCCQDILGTKQNIQDFVPKQLYVSLRKVVNLLNKQVDTHTPKYSLYRLLLTFTHNLLSSHPKVTSRHHSTSGE